MTTSHTEGPWRWEFNAEHRSVHLVGGKPQFDLTVMDFTRWGMAGAGIRLRELSERGMDLLHKLHERPDWIAPFPGREHHSHWLAAVNHPDMRLIAAAPDLLDACMAMIEWDDRENDHAVDFYVRMNLCRAAFDKARAAIVKATA